MGRDFAKVVLGTRKTFIQFFIILPLLTTSICRGDAAALRSPWDDKPVKATDAPYTCPPVAHLPVDFVTSGFYADNDPTHSIVDPVKMRAYAESSAPVKRDGDVVVAAADAYRTTGSLAAARCVIEHVEANARNRSLTGKMSSNQAYYVQGWVLGAEALAYLKVRGAGVVSKEQARLILPWMKEVATQTRGFYTRRRDRTPPRKTIISIGLEWSLALLELQRTAAVNTTGP